MPKTRRFLNSEIRSEIRQKISAKFSEFSIEKFKMGMFLKQKERAEW